MRPRSIPQGLVVTLSTAANMLLQNFNLFVRVKFFSSAVAQPALSTFAQLCLHVEAFIELDVELTVFTFVDSFVFASGFKFTDGCHNNPPLAVRAVQKKQ